MVMPKLKIKLNICIWLLIFVIRIKMKSIKDQIKIKTRVAIPEGIANAMQSIQRVQPICKWGS